MRVKTCLLQNEIKRLKFLGKTTLELIQSLAIFFLTYHVKYWLLCTSPTNAPTNDLELYQLLLKDIDLMKTKNMVNLPVKFLQMSEAYLLKLDHHLWFLSERLCILSLFSDHLPTAEKKTLASTLLKQKKSTSKVNQNIPTVSKNTHLKHLIGSDSWTLFNLLEIETDFLHKNPTNWMGLESYTKARQRVKNLVVVNDGCERALGLLTKYNTNHSTTDKKQKQFSYQIIQNLRKRRVEATTSFERCTKTNMKKYLI